MSQDQIIASLSRELTVPLPESNAQDILDTLKAYVSKLGEISLINNKESPPLPIEVSDIISQISSNAKVLFPWRYLRPALMIKLKEVLTEFAPVVEEKHEEELSIFNNIDTLLLQRFKSAPPFTIQRLCDLLSEPKRYYKTKLKYLRAIEKVLTVISNAKVHYRSPPQSTSCSEPRFSPPSKRLKQELSNASTIIVSSDSLSSTDKNNSGQLTYSFGEVSSKSEEKDEIESKQNDVEQYLECSVSEADSTTVNESRSSQDANECKEVNEVNGQETSQQSKDSDIRKDTENPPGTTESDEQVAKES